MYTNLSEKADIEHNRLLYIFPDNLRIRKKQTLLELKLIEARMSEFACF